MIIKNTMADKDYDGAFDRVIEEALTEAGVIIEGAAISRVPSPGRTGTGRTKGSLTYATKKQHSNAKSPASNADRVSTPTDKWTLYVGTNVEYAQHLEYGTFRMSPRPYLRPALLDNKQRIIRMVQDHIRDGLKRGH